MYLLSELRRTLTFMPGRIPQTIEYEIFQTWLCGVFRHQNAKMHGVSDATVSNVVAEHRRRHGYQLDHLRALITLKGKLRMLKDTLE